MAMLGEQFMVGEEICGAVVSVRYQVRNKGNFYLWRSRTGLGLLRDVLLLVVILVGVLPLLSRQPPTKIFI